MEISVKIKTLLDCFVFNNEISNNKMPLLSSLLLKETFANIYI